MKRMILTAALVLVSLLRAETTWTKPMVLKQGYDAAAPKVFAEEAATAGTLKTVVSMATYWNRNAFTPILSFRNGTDAWLTLGINRKNQWAVTGLKPSEKAWCTKAPGRTVLGVAWDKNGWEVSSGSIVIAKGTQALSLKEYVFAAPVVKGKRKIRANVFDGYNARDGYDKVFRELSYTTEKLSAVQIFESDAKAETEAKADK